MSVMVGNRPSGSSADEGSAEGLGPGMAHMYIFQSISLCWDSEPEFFQLKRVYDNR